MFYRQLKSPFVPFQVAGQRLQISVARAARVFRTLLHNKFRVPVRAQRRPETVSDLHH